MSFTIRPVGQNDRDDWERLFAAYADFYRFPVAAGAFDRVWDWIFDPQNDFWCDLLVSETGVTIGFTQYQLMHRSLDGSMVCYLSDLFVEPHQRGRGGGRMLIDHVIDFARSQDIGNVRWLTQDFNYAGRQLYDSYSPKSDFILYSVKVE